ncbi:MAG: hypothetical protein ORN57_01775, partial [Alphaproteobacteria bacterium]|nr:hypothetical protein [Alphaproteobacteria bacterium]
MKRELLRSTAIGGLFLDNNNGRGDKKATVNNQRRDGRGFDLLAVGGRLATAGMLSLGLWSMAGPALAIGGRDLTTNFNGKEENNGGDRLPMVIPISLPNDYDTDNNNSNHYWQQVTLVAADNASAAKRPVQKTQAVKKSPAVRKSPAGKKSSAVKKSPAVGKNKANTKELLVKISIDNVQADPANANRPKDKPVVKSVAQIIVPAVSPIVSKSGFYIRPEGEAILTNGTFTSDGKLGIGAGGSVFMGYRYAPNGLSAGHFGGEIGGGFFMPRLDSISEQPPEPIGPVSFGAQTNMVSRSNVVAGSFVNGLTQATTRSDAGLVAVSSANGVTFMVSQGMTQSVLDSSLSAVVTNSRNTSIANLWGKTIGGTSSRVLSNFAATDVNSSNQYIVTDNTTTTVIFG